MLDLETILLVDLTTAVLQAAVWILVWRSWRHLYELKFIAAGFSAVAVGLLLMLLRGPQPALWHLVVDNTVIKLGLVLMAEGLARFLGQPSYSWVGATLLAGQVGLWSLAVAADPGDLATRIHASTVFTLVMMSLMCLTLARDRTQPGLLRWITVGVLVEYMAASIALSVIEYRSAGGLPSTAVLSDRNAWYLFQGNLFQVALFACLLFMVGSRLSADLRDRNEALTQEVRERRRLETQLQASLETERALREEQVDLMRVVSHEFRTPLAVIRNAVDMICLSADRPAEATRARIAGIGEALDRLFALIDRFMTSDREPGYRPRAVEAASLVADALRHFELSGRGGRLSCSAEGGRGVAVLADPEMMATVLINLLDNALKYSSDDAPVEIDVVEEPDRVAILVRDRGIGIPDAERARIGRRFFRASNTEAGTGTGLGLYSARKFLAHHGGTLHLRPNDGPGLTATVHLPLMQRASTEIERSEVEA